ncbi:MAG: CFI-box-CTERM domain-containing protein [Candidatus Ratteibacteria bacterium]
MLDKTIVKKTVMYVFSLLCGIGISCAWPQISVNATRSFSSPTYLPGQRIDITLSVEITGMPRAVIVEETIPETWQITSSNLPVNKFTAPSTYSWLEFSATGISSVIIRYSVSIPEDATGVQNFNGVVKYFDGTDMQIIPVGGQTSISLPPTGFGASPESLHFGTVDTTATITLTNLGSTPINWTSAITTDDGITGWLRINPNSGSLGSGQSTQVQAQIVRTLLTSGSHTGMITFNDGINTVNVKVSAIVGSPSPVSDFSASGLFNEILLTWQNPNCFTGTIIFRKNAPLAWDDKPVNGTSYTIGSSLPGGAICVFKDTTDKKTSFIDDTVVDTNYYRIFSFDDGSAPSYYSLYSTGYSDTFSKTVPIGTIWAGDNLFTETQFYTDPFGYNLFAFFNSSGVTEPNSQVKVGYVESTYIPTKLINVVGFKNTYLLSSNFTLNLGDTVDIKIPVRYDELALVDTSVTLARAHVYHWPGENNNWEDITSYVTERNLEEMYIKVRLNAEQLKGNDYFSIGTPIPPVHSGSSGCFIATAAYGTPFAKEVEALRKFRDQKLLKTRAGRAFVRFYYRHSPVIADFIKDKPKIKAFVRGMLKPIVWMCGKIVG